MLIRTTPFLGVEEDTGEFAGSKPATARFAKPDCESIETSVRQNSPPKRTNARKVPSYTRN
jgi:hypothetical protein